MAEYEKSVEDAKVEFYDGHEPEAAQALRKALEAERGSVVEEAPEEEDPDADEEADESTDASPVIQETGTRNPAVAYATDTDDN